MALVLSFNALLHWHYLASRLCSAKVTARTFIFLNIILLRTTHSRHFISSVYITVNFNVFTCSSTLAHSTLPCFVISFLPCTFHKFSHFFLKHTLHVEIERCHCLAHFALHVHVTSPITLMYVTVNFNVFTCSSALAHWTLPCFTLLFSSIVGNLGLVAS